MTNIKDLKIYIVEYNLKIASAFANKFKKLPNVKIINDDILHFFNTHRKEIDCLVSPANSFGHMTGGYDARLSDILGWDFQKKVQKYIKDNYYGEQPVTSSFIIKTPFENVYLIHTPSMRYPSPIIDDEVVYHCTRSSLICALKNDIKCIVLPVYGGLTGQIEPEVAASRMLEAIAQLYAFDDKIHQNIK